MAGCTIPQVIGPVPLHAAAPRRGDGHGVDRDRFSERLPVMPRRPDVAASRIAANRSRAEAEDRASGDPSHEQQTRQRKSWTIAALRSRDRQDCLPLQREESDRCRSRARQCGGPILNRHRNAEVNWRHDKPMPGAGVIVRRTLQPAAHDELPHGSGERAKQQRGPRP